MRVTILRYQAPRGEVRSRGFTIVTGEIRQSLIPRISALPGFRFCYAVSDQAQNALAIISGFEYQAGTEESIRESIRITTEVLGQPRFADYTGNPPETLIDGSVEEWHHASQ
jgi:hypothetical protein